MELFCATTPQHSDEMLEELRGHQELLAAHLGLHCLSICLELPAELADPPAEQLRVRCPVRPELLRLWQTLPWWDEACAALPELAADAADAAAEAARHEAAEAQARADGEPPPGKLEASVAPRSYCFY